MSWKVKDSLRHLDVSEMEELLKQNTYPAQRRLNPRRINGLWRKFENGLYHTPHVATMSCNGTTHLANGQHNLSMLVKHGISHRVFFQEFSCDSPSDFAKVFSQFDDANLRAAGQVAFAHAHAIGMGWNKRCAATCASALAWHHFGMQQASNVSKEERAELLEKYRDHVDFVYHLLFQSNKNAPFMTRVPVATAMIATFDKHRSDADVFWSSVRDGDMLKSTDPAFRLREYLMRVSVAHNNLRAAETGDVATRRAVYVKSIHAWNAYRKGGNTDLKFYSQKPDPTIM